MDRSKSRIMTTAVGAVIALLLGTAGVARSQSAAEHIALGNKERDARNPTAALQHYEAAIAADPNEYDALRKAAYDARGARRVRAERRTAHRAVPKRRTVRASRRRGKSARRRRTLSARASARTKRADDGHARPDQVRERGPRASARRARDRPEALRRAARHGRVERRGHAPQRLLADDREELSRRVRVFDDANWDNAQKYLEDAVAVEPNAHHAPPRSGGGVRGPRSEARRRSSSTSGSLARRSPTTTIRSTRTDAMRPPHGASLTRARLVTAGRPKHLAARDEPAVWTARVSGPSRVLAALWRGEQGGRRAEQCPDGDAGGENQRAIGAIGVRPPRRRDDGASEPLSVGSVSSRTVGAGARPAEDRVRRRT